MKENQIEVCCYHCCMYVRLSVRLPIRLYLLNGMGWGRMFNPGRFMVKVQGQTYSDILTVFHVCFVLTELLDFFFKYCGTDD